MAESMQHSQLKPAAPSQLSASPLIPSSAHQILRTDVSGMPLEWINYQDAARLHHVGQVAYYFGSKMYELRGGINACSGLRTKLTIHSIIATHGNSKAIAKVHDYVPPLNNRTLFKRDGYLCMYCGNHFKHSDLSRDHIKPVSQKGLDIWTNVVTACRRCNNYKADRTPEQAGLELLAVPFAPNHAEYIYLKGRRILADQMEFLLAHFPRKSPLRNRTLHLS